MFLRITLNIQLTAVHNIFYFENRDTNVWSEKELKNLQRMDELEEEVTSNGSTNCDVPVPNNDCSLTLRLPGGSIFNGHSESVQDMTTPLISELELNEDRRLPTNSKATLEGKTQTTV